MKKVLLVTRPIAPPWDEASKNFAYFLAKNNRDFEFNLLTPGQIDSLEKHIQQIPIYTSNSLNLNWKQRLKLFKLRSKLKDFDLVHFMLTPSRLNSWAFKTFLTNSKIKTVQTVATLRQDLFSDEQLKKIMFADLVITYSDWAKNKLEQVGVKNVRRIYPGIDLELNRPTEKDPETLKFFNLSSQDFVITYPGEYVRLGATDFLVKSLPLIFQKIPTAKFVFACRIKNEKDAQKKAEVQKSLQQKNILDRVVFTDTFAQMPKLYNLSDIVVFPVQNMHGKFDVPLAAIEAMACAKPLVISNLPILQEFAKPDNSVIINPTDQAEFIKVLQELKNDPLKCESLGKAARKYAQENFDILNVSQKYSEIYNSLI